MVYDVIIIGSGPAGLAAGIYAKRARLSSIIIEKEYVSGGQVLNTYEVDNYPGLPGINGFDLGMKLREHCEKLGAEFVTAEVELVSLAEDGRTKLVKTQDQTYEAKTLILAMGARHRMLEVPGEEEFAGMGGILLRHLRRGFFQRPGDGCGGRRRRSGGRRSVSGQRLQQGLSHSPQGQLAGGGGSSGESQRK